MITISNGWTGSFPDTFFGVLVIEGINNTRGEALIENRKTLREEELRQQYRGKSRKEMAQEPPFEAYERHFRKFGQGYPVLHQIETVALKGKPILSPSPLVAAMFMAELKNGLLTAGHDLDKVSPPLVLDVARGGERYVAMGGRERELKEGDVFLSDREGILSSVLYGPDDRSYITSNTSRALFTSYGVTSIGAETLGSHLEEIGMLVHLISPDASTQVLNVIP
jgi:DNA/RNA-binding domain of Phe-tRNA-synthetase-like protein